MGQVIQTSKTTELFSVSSANFSSPQSIPGKSKNTYFLGSNIVENIWDNVKSEVHATKMHHELKAFISEIIDS